MNAKSAVVFLLLFGLLTACNVPTPVPATELPSLPVIPPTSLPFATANPPEVIQPPTSIPPSVTPKTLNETILERAGEVVHALKTQDMVTLSGYVHPQNGVRFSPYAYVQDTDQVFSADEIASILADSAVYTWGFHAGSGEPIVLSFMAYFSRYVYDVDFANSPQLALNRRISTGNSIDNSTEFYPGSVFVEYFFPGFDPQYEGMDWRNLRLVFTENSGSWYLVGILHDEWTP